MSTGFVADLWILRQHIVSVHRIPFIEAFQPPEHSGGTAFISDPNRAYLWTKGWTPRLRTIPVWEVPNPLIVEICRVDADIEVVLKDVLALTKLNYNTCRFGDGKPITLKFADAIGEVLITRPVKDAYLHPFMYYI
jgi:hypothetical protein